ncbi:MAG: type VI secretion system tube protein Hcp [Vicinamibacterales bacterium]
MFLYVRGAVGGVFKGESQDQFHKGEIEVQSWSWGMQAQVGFGGAPTASRGRASILELKIVKRVDSASTALMAALRNNEKIIKALLTIRKAGSALPLEYLKVTVEDGRVVAVNIDGGRGATGTELVEHISFSFNKISVEYVPQGDDGRPQGGMLFSDQFHEG